MMARLYFNAGYTAKCIMAALSLAVLCTFTAGAQSREFSVSVSGGFARAVNMGNSSSFPEARVGSYVQLSGMRPLGKNWGVIVSLEHNLLSSDNYKTAERFLYDDPNAAAVTVEAGSFNITNAGAGVYYNWNLGNSVFIRFAPTIGYSYMRTPQTKVFVETEPNTSYTYKAGGSSALFYAFLIRPVLKISERCAIFYDMSYTHAGYGLSGISGNKTIDNTIQYGKVNIGAGVQIQF